MQTQVYILVRGVIFNSRILLINISLKIFVLLYKIYLEIAIELYEISTVCTKLSTTRLSDKYFAKKIDPSIKNQQNYKLSATWLYAKLAIRQFFLKIMVDSFNWSWNSYIDRFTGKKLTESKNRNFSSLNCHNKIIWIH